MGIWDPNEWYVTRQGKNKFKENDIVYFMKIGGGLDHEDFYFDISVFISKENYEKILDGTYNIARFLSWEQPIIIYDKDKNIIPLVKGKDDIYEDSHRRFIEKNNLKQSNSINKNNIIMGTGNYNNVKSGNIVSVTGDGGNAWGYFGSAYKKLAPKLVTYTPYAEKYQKLLELRKDSTKIKEYIEYRKQIEDEYIKSYYDIRLKDLDVEELLNTLYEKFGSNIILLCHEEICEFCHRRLIADYIELKTNIHIPEIAVDEKGKVKKLSSIDYKDRLKNLMK